MVRGQLFVTASTSKSKPLTRNEWILISLLVSSIFINYIDRGNLSIAAPVIQRELSFSPLQMGSLLSAFFFTYASLQLAGVAGWLADHFPVSAVLAAGFLIWSLATVVTGLVSGFEAIFLSRLILGAGESLAYPCYSRIFATDLPQHHRGRANALLDAGSKLGPAVGSLIGGIMIARVGWRLFFVSLGVISLIWLIPWLRCKPCTQAAFKAQESRVRLPSMTQLFTQRSAWGAFAGHFCGNYFWFFLLTWIPSYLVTERHYSVEAMSRISSVAFAVAASSTALAGWVSDRAILRGISVTTVRKVAVVCGLALACVILPAAYVEASETAVVFLLLSCVAFGLYTSNHWAITQTLAGPLLAGRWTSLQNGIGNVSGIVAPWLAGLIVQRTGSSKLAFGISAVIVLIGAAMWGLVVGKVEEISWTTTEERVHT
jgi:MFS transporter, ACS family, D-galactonate transporter